jgi:UDP-3-O-[3-hydroxymyristoyl] N-acetylglucosamine deacetylase
MVFSSRHQFTLNGIAKIQGTGVFTGKNVSIEIKPAPADSGIVFVRLDQEGSPEIRANVSDVLETPRCTILRNEKTSIQTVEHLLAALSGCHIDNALIEVNGPEIPILDGSCMGFVELIEQVGVKQLEVKKQIYSLDRPLYYVKGDTFLVALPSDDFKLTYTLAYPGHPLLEAQTHSVCLTPSSFKAEIAPSRTFVLFEEIAPLIERGVIKGGDLGSGVVIKGKEVLNPEGLRFSNEMARHKILDLIGDLSLAGFSLNAHIIAMRSGHGANAEFAKEISQYFSGRK